MTALQTVNFGVQAGGTDGDTVRAAFTKINSNVGALVAQLPITSAATITTAQALTAAAHLGKRVNINLSATGTVNLPKASTCAADSVILLRNVGSVAVTIAATSGSGDTINVTGLVPGAAVLADSDGVNTWRTLARVDIPGNLSGFVSISGTAASIPSPFVFGNYAGKEVSIQITDVPGTLLLDSPANYAVGQSAVFRNIGVEVITITAAASTQISPLGGAAAIGNSVKLYQGETLTLLVGSNTTWHVAGQSRYVPFYGQAYASDALGGRGVKPQDLPNERYLMAGFVEKEAMDNNVDGSTYADALFLNSYVGTSAGNLNALLMLRRPTQRIYHYQGTYQGATWTASRPIAYADNEQFSGPVNSANPQNQLPNSSGELGNLGWGSTAFIGTVDASGAPVFAQLPAASGSTVQDYSDYLPAEPSTAYYLSGEANSVAATAGTLQVDYFFYDSTKTQLSSGTFISQPVGTAWAYQGKTVTSPAGAAYFRMRRNLSSTPTSPAGGCMLRKLKYEKASLPSQYSQEASVAAVWRALGSPATAAAGITVPALSVLGTTTFGTRPTFAGNTAWDSGNFTPGNYLPITGATPMGGMLTGWAAAGTGKASFYAYGVEGAAFAAWATAASAVRMNCASSTSAYKLLHATRAGGRDIGCFYAYEGGSGSSSMSMGIFAGSAQYSFNDTGIATAVTWSSLSDRRLKNTIEDMDNSSAYEFVKRVRVVSYFLNGENAGAARIQYGVIADELADLDASLVQGQAGDTQTIGGEEVIKPQSVDYRGLDMRLFSAFQKLQGDFEDALSMIAALKERLAKLEAAT